MGYFRLCVAADGSHMGWGHTYHMGPEWIVPFRLYLLWKEMVGLVSLHLDARKAIQDYGLDDIIFPSLPSGVSRPAYAAADLRHLRAFLVGRGSSSFGCFARCWPVHSSARST